MGLKFSRLDGSNGFRLNGIDAYDGSGESVARAGDVNGDGIDDFIIGAPYAGESYVVFGCAAGFAASFDLAALDGANGFRLDGNDRGDASRLRPASVAGAGDFNDDGIDDLIIGAPQADESYVIFGSAAGFGANLDLAALDGSDGFRLDGGGHSVSGAGDINGDGIDDLIIGAPYANPGGGRYSPSAGESYVVFGSAAGFGASIDLAALDGSNGFRLNRIDSFDWLGVSVASAGDVNGDGLDDLIIGAEGARVGERGGAAGKSYVVFGSAAGFGASLDLAALDGTNGFRLDAIDPYDSSGYSVARAGDVNGDGLDDLIIGAWRADTYAGESYVVFGSTAGFGASLELAALDGSNGFRLDGIDEGDGSGRSVAGAGDVNGDGIDDLIIGGPGADPGGRTTAGASYVVFGSAAGFGACLDLATVDGSKGFRLNGIDAFDGSGLSVAGAGDINSDGIDDLIVGAPFANPGGRYNAGDSYVVFGSTRLGGANDAPTAADDALSVGSLEVVDLAGDNGAGSDHDPDLDDLSITAVNGILVATGDSVTLASGLRITVLGAAEVGFDAPGVALGASLSDSFVYEISDGRSGSDTATVSVDYLQNAIDLAALDGVNGFRLDGINAYDQSGWSVASAGDVNGDGVDDLIIGARLADPDGRYTAGESYVVFGSIDGFTASLDLAALDGATGFRLGGIDAFDSSGASVAGAGDVNGDGLDDLIIGAYGGSVSDAAGKSYVVFGSPAGFGANLDLAALDGANGFRLDGIDANDQSGFSVAGAGDVNGDGIDDLIIGAPYANESYVIFGSAAGFGASLDLAALDGSDGFRLDGAGHSVSGAGDINGDGIDDLIIGAPSYANESYVVFGSAAGFGASLDLAALDRSEGFRLDGIDANDQSGFSVAGAGDVNGDGIDDLIIGAPYAGGRYSPSGESYVVFGSAAGFGASIDLTALGGADGFRIINGIDAGDRSGFSVAGAGDFNDDGIDDLIIGAWGADSYVVYGSAAGFAASLHLAALDGIDGFRLDGKDGSGHSVAGAGDVNGDGIDDLIIGAPFALPGGESHVVFGFRSTHTLLPIDGGPGRDVLTGTDASEAFHPGGGCDFLTTGGGDDMIYFDDRVGKRDVVKIADFDPLTDTLDLKGATVAKTFECGQKTVFLLEGEDRDAIVLLGVTDSPFDFLI